MVLPDDDGTSGYEAFMNETIAATGVRFFYDRNFQYVLMNVNFGDHRMITFAIEKGRVVPMTTPSMRQDKGAIDLYVMLAKTAIRKTFEGWK